jgi:mannose-1-phosphate guanylyltransferase
MTQSIAECDRPKQFCPLLGGKTLLAQTRVRTLSIVDPDRTLYVLTRKHECFYGPELASEPTSRMIVQPENRGTLPAILWSLLRIAQLDRHASVAFFPSDHYYTNERKFVDGVQGALDSADLAANSVILLGAVAERPEVEYGWIEPHDFGVNRDGTRFRRVKRFWEKPSPQIAQDLLDRGCLWNTFVMVGRSSAFLEIIREAVPKTYDAFEEALVTATPETEDHIMRRIYDALPPADFSRQVLAISTERLQVASLDDIGWSDLGDPRRLVTTLFEHGIANPWVRSGCCKHCGLILSESSSAQEGFG